MPINFSFTISGAHSVPLETIAAGPTAIEVKGQEEIKQEPVEIKQEPSVPEVAPKITVSNEVESFFILFSPFILMDFPIHIGLDKQKISVKL